MNNQAVITAGRKAALTAVKYICLFAAMIPLSCARIYGIRPFGAGFLTALVMCGIPVYFAAPVFVAAEAVARPDLYCFLSALVCVAAVVGAALVRKKSEKICRYLLPLFILLSQSGAGLFVSGGSYTPLMLAVSLLLTLAFAYASQVGLRPILKEKLRYKLLETEVVCLCVVLTATGLGLGLLDIYAFPTIAAVAAFCIFVSARLAGVGAASVVALCLGLGDALNTYNVFTLASFLFIAAVASVFTSAPRILTALSGVVAYVMFAFYFDDNYIRAAWHICALCVGGALYTLVPQKFLTDIKEKVFSSHERAAVRFMINKNRADVGASLINSARIFETMSAALNSEKPKAQNAGSLEVKCCGFCENKDDCSAAGVLGSLGAMVRNAGDKGYVAVSDIPDAVAAKCVHLGKLVAAANEIEENRRKLALKDECESSAKKLVSGQLNGVATVLKNAAAKTCAPLPYDARREKILVEELNYCGISCAQSLIAGDEITLIVRTECLEKKLIEKTVGRIMRAEYKTAYVDDTMLSGFCAVMLKKRPKYDMVFGIASCPKTPGEKSGDTHSFIKLDSSRFMLALCDGMGSGEKAEKMSETAIGLVENFFRAGFDGNAALASVNKFLSLDSSEGFSALDIAVVDLDSAKADIIKLSTPATYVKRKDVVGKIEGGGLPLGAVDSVSPSVTTVDLKSGDMLVMASDGVADCFEGDKLAAAVNNLRTTNPQILAQGILEHTLALTGGTPRDDSTVIAAKLITL